MKKGSGGMTDQQSELARHALGLTGQRLESYRNYFTAGRSHDDYADWMAMCDAGYAERRVTAMCGGDDVFRLTRKGAHAALKPGQFLNAEDWP